MIFYLNKYIFNHLVGLNEYLHEPEQIIMGLLAKYEMKYSQILEYSIGKKIVTKC